MSQTSLSIDQDAFMSSSVPSTSSSSSASSSPSPWHELPEDVYLLVFALLDPVSLSRAARVCRLWRQVVASKTLWRRVRLPYVSKQKLRQFIARRLDVDCKKLSISGSCVLQTDNNSGLRSSAIRKTVISATLVELLQGKAPHLEEIEIRRDNLTTQKEVLFTDILKTQVKSFSAIECYAGTEFFWGGWNFISDSSRSHLTCLDLSGSNRIADYFLCSSSQELFMEIYRLERRYCVQQQQIQGTPNPAGDIQDYIPTEELMPAGHNLLLKLPNLKTLKLNRLYRLTCSGIKVLTSVFNDNGNRVSLRDRLERLELMETGLADDTVLHLRSLTSLRYLRLDDHQHMTPLALERVINLSHLEYLSLDKIIDPEKITERLGIQKADEIMDRLLFRVFQDFKALRRLSLYGLFATSPPIAAMKLTWPFLTEQLPKLEAVSFCKKRHFLPVKRDGQPVKIADCYYCNP